MRLSFIWRSTWFDLVIEQDRVNMTAFHQGDKTLPVEIYGQPFELKPGKSVEARRPKK